MCDTLVTLTDEGVLLGKNSDRDPNEAQVLRWHAAAQHEPGTLLRTTWSSLPQVERTHAVLLSQPWWMWGAEIGANEHGVTIGNEAVFTRRTGEGGDGALLGMDLLRLALERGATRHEAVEVLVSLLEEHGQGGSCSREHPRFTYDNSFIVADPSGAVVVETAGRRWATEEVVGHRSISNGLTIRGFAQRYADPVRGRVASCLERRARTTEAARRATGPGELVAALRDHGDRTWPAYSVVNGALSAPCAHAGGVVTSTQTTASWVADLRPGTPAGGRHWVTGTSAPCTALFKPVTVGERREPESDREPSNRFDPHFLWWRHEVVHRSLLLDPARAMPELVGQRDALERAWLESPPSAKEAFAAGDVLVDDWTDRLRSAGPVADRRPVWVRRQWRTWDRQAGLATGRVEGAQR